MGALLAAIVTALALTPAATVRAQVAGQTTPTNVSAATNWSFAEGTTLPGFFEFIVIANPDPANAITVQIDYQLEQSANTPAGGKNATVNVPAGARRTIAVYDEGPGVGRPFTGVSAKLTSSRPFVAERPIYFERTFDIGLVNETHNALGVNAPSRKWYFAEGSTLAGFQPFFSIQNVSGGPANVAITYFTDNPVSTVGRTITVPNNSRFTIDISKPEPAPGALGPGFEGFGAVLDSDREITIERPIYLNREFPALGPIDGATNEAGATSTQATTRLFAEGTVLDSFQEFLAVFNPNNQATNLELAYNLEGQTAQIIKSLTVPAGARRTIQVFNASDPAGIGRAIPQASAPGSAGVSVRIRSINGVGFVAERPMYFNTTIAGALAVGAHTVLGPDAASASWFFAEGTLRVGFFEFITIQNPNNSAAIARLDYLVDGGPVVTRIRNLPPASRVTVSAFEPGSPGAFGQAASEIDFGLRVTSVDAGLGAPDPALPIVVERPIYVSTVIAGALAVAGGHNAAGYRFTDGIEPPLAQTPILSVDKTGPATAITGREATYTITVTNGGTGAAEGLVVSDIVPSGATIVRSTLASVPSTLAAGSSTTANAVVVYSAVGTFTDTAVADPANGPPAADSFVTVVSGAPVTPASADLSVVKTDTPDPVVATTPLTYTITVTNNGPNTATNVTVSDTLPPASQATLQSASASQGSCSGTVFCSLGSLANGTTATVTIVVVPTAAAGPGTITNRASVAATQSDPAPANNTDSEDTTVLAGPADVSVTKSATPTIASAGGTITYTIGVTNNGPDTADNTTVTDVVPTGTTVSARATTAGTCTESPAGTVVCGLGSLTPATTATVTIAVTVSPSATPGTITNTASARTSSTDTNPANNSGSATTTLVAGPADVAVALADAPDPVTGGSQMTYTLTASNAGPDDASGVVLSQTLPTGVTIVSLPAGCTASGSDVTCTAGSLVPGASISYSIVTMVSSATSPGTITSTASVSATTTDPVPSNNTDTEPTIVLGGPANLTITKVSNPDPVLAGSLVTSTITILNQGPDDAPSVLVTDTLAPGAVFVSASPGCSASGQVVTCMVGSLAPSASAVLTVVARATGAVSGPPLLYGLTQSGRLVSFSSAVPGTFLSDVALSGLVGGEQPVGIDFHPRSGGLYTVTSAGRIYLVNPATGTTTLTNTIAVPLTATAYGVDYNPAANALRIVGDNTQNIRVTAGGTGPAVADGNLFYDPADLIGGGVQPVITAAGYTNNYDGAASTVLYDLDANLDTLVIQSPPNTGRLTTVGAVGIDFGGPTGFDIAASGVAYAALTNQPSTATGLYTLDLASGAATLVGPVQGGTTLRGLAVAAANTTLTNTATTTSGAADPNPADNTTTTVVGVTARNPGVQTVDLAVAKSDAPDPATFGGPIRYVITATAPAPSGTVTLTDTLPAGLSGVTATPSQGSCQIAGTTIVCEVGSVTLQRPVTVTIDATINTNGVITNTVTAASAPTIDPDLTNNTAVATTTITAASLTIAKTDTPDPAAAGATLTYTITVANGGPDPATGVSVSDTLPAGVTYASATSSQGTCTEAGGLVQCALGAVASGAQAQVTITVTPNLSAAGTTITNTAAVTSATGDTNLADNRAAAATAIGAAADIAVTKTDSPDPVAVGQPLAYTIAVANQGPNPATGVTLTDTLPGAVTLGPLPPGCAGANPVICTIGTIAANATATITLNVTPTAAAGTAGTITNTVTATAGPGTADPVPSNNTDTEPTTVTSVAGLSITKTDAPDPAVAGSTVTYTVTATNAGPSPAENVVVTDAPPPNTTVTARPRLKARAQA